VRERVFDGELRNPRVKHKKHINQKGSFKKDKKSSMENNVARMS